MPAEPLRRRRDPMAGSRTGPRRLRSPDSTDVEGIGNGQVVPTRPRSTVQARNSPLRLVPSGALVVLGAGTALESSFRDLTIP